MDDICEIGPKCLLPPCTFGSTQYNKLRHSATQEYRSRATVCRAATSSGRLIQKRMVFGKQVGKNVGQLKTNTDPFFRVQICYFSILPILARCTETTPN